MSTNNGFDFFCSWSGGKDSCLALYRMQQSGHTCNSLFTRINENGTHSRSHNLNIATLNAQATALGLTIHVGNATWNAYEKEFIQMVTLFKNRGLQHGVFGDIDLEPHKQWVERVCGEAGVTPHEPLWKGNRRSLVREFIEAGFKARIVVVNTKLMPKRFLGRDITMEIAEELETVNVDACGENGEYHSFAYAGPLFSKTLKLTNEGQSEHDGYAFLNFTAS
jgi:diphthine-ammonia ligase